MPQSKLLIQKVSQKGRGVFAAQPFKKGDVIEVCPIVILSPKDRKAIDTTILYNYKETKDLRFRLAETEHELAARTPLAVGSRPMAVQPQTAVVANQLEDARAAVRAGDLLHAHINPFI